MEKKIYIVTAGEYSDYTDYDDEDTNDTPFIILYVHELQHALKLRKINREIKM